MTGFSRTPSASSPRSVAPVPRTGLGVTLSVIGVAAALGASACDSSLGGGNASMMPDPFGSPNSNGANPNAPGSTSNVMGQPGATESRNPSLSTIQNNGPVVDATGAPLPPDMLAPLTMCGTAGPRQIRRL